MADVRLEALAAQGVRTLRVGYADLHGYARAKDVPLAAAEGVIDHGVGFCEGIMTIDLGHNVVLGFEAGLRDVVARLDLDTAVRLPWEPDVAWVLCDLVSRDGEPYPVDPRGCVRRAVAAFGELGLQPVIAPELEFYLFQPDPTSPSGWARYVDVPSNVYTVGAQSDPRNVLTRMLHACVDLGLDAVAACHEFGASQYEINIRHADALTAADRAFRQKATVKELAARDGLLATFIGKPVNGDEGSGFHLHVSARTESGENAFADAASPDGLSATARHFTAGVLEHAQGLSAFLMPTVNAYRRLDLHSLAPTHVNWGFDNRLCLARVPAERGAAARVEFRSGDGAANPYLAVAAVLFAGLDGVRRELEPPEPLGGNPYELDPEEWGAELPGNLGAALDALAADATIVEGMGATLVDWFTQVKRNEVERHHKWVSDWDFKEYARHL
jgi:glutamine synthetase